MFPSGKKQVTKAITVHAQNTRPCGWLWLQSHKHVPPAQRSFQNLSCHWHLSMCWTASQPCWSFKSAHHYTCCKLRCTCRWVAPVWVVGEPPPATLLPACMPHPLLLCFYCRRHHTPLCRPNRKLHSQAANGPLRPHGPLLIWAVTALQLPTALRLHGSLLVLLGIIWYVRH